MTLISATREGARLAATNCTATDCTGAVRAKTIAAATGITPTVSVVCRDAAGTPTGCSNTQSGDSATVSSNWTYHMIWPLTFGTEIPLGYSIKMSLE
jgi:hypothetical protein